MAKATAIFDGDDSRFQKAVRAIEKSLQRVQARFSEMGAFAAKALAVPAAAAVALGVGIKNALDTGDSFNDLSANTGIAVKDLAILEQEFKNAGKSGEDIGKVIGKMQKGLAEGGADDIIGQLGIDLESLKAKTPVEQFHALGEGINGITDPAEKTAAAMAIFGKEGASLLAMFAAGGFGDASAQVGEQAEILNRDAALFGDVGDKLALVGLKVRGFFIGVADKVAPVLKPLLDGFANLDLAAMGQQIGEMIAFLIQAFSDGKLGELLTTSFMISASNFGNALIGAVYGVGAALMQLFKDAPQALITYLSVLTSQEFWAGLGYALLAAAQGFIALILTGFQKLLAMLEDLPGIGGAAGKAATGLGNVAGDLNSRASANAARAVPNLTSVGGVLLDDVLKRAGNAASAFSGGYDGAPKLFDNTAREKQLNDLTSSIWDSMEKTRATSLAAAPTAQPKVADALAKQLDFSGGKDNAITSLQKIGGAFGRGGAGRDPMIEAQRQTNSLLAQIRDKLPAVGAKQKMEFVPSYG